MKKKLALIGGALAVCIAAYLLWTYQPWRTEPEEPPVPDTPVENTAEPEPAYVSPIDFASLQERCPDIYAWLEIPDTDISYPVAQNADDTWYLTRDIDGNYSSDGTLFTESAYNGTDLTDPATVIYGHRMNSGAMFGTLQKTYSDPESFEAHREIVLYLPDQEIHATVFAAVPYDNRHILYNYNFENARMTRLFLNSVRLVRDLGANLDEDAFPQEGDRMVILSTCQKGNRQMRYLVLAKWTPS